MNALEQLNEWLASIKAADFFTWWAVPILLLTGLGLWILIGMTIRVLSDRSALKFATTLESQGFAPKMSLDQLGGVVKLWSDAIVGRAAQGHPSGVNELELVLHHRYSSSQQWVEWIRTSCTTIGLFFTFFGLGLALKDLGEALQMSKDVVEVNQLSELLKKVQAVLPIMGTAFASSIAGIGSSFFLGFLENLVNSAQNNLGSRLAELSMRWLEPNLLPMNDTSALMSITEAIRTTQQEISSAAEIQRDSIARLDRLSQQFELFPDMTERAMRALAHELKQWGVESAQSVNQILGELITSWEERTLEVRSVLELAQENAYEYTSSFNEMSENLQASSRELQHFLSSMNSDLQLSAEYISGLSDAAETFKDAQLDSNQIISDSRVIQSQMLTGMTTVFSELPMMTQAITEASTLTAASADKLQKVILNSQMDAYISRLADLAQFAEREKASREHVFKVFEQLSTFGETVESLNMSVTRIGQTTAALERSHERLEAKVEGLHQDFIYPILGELVETSVSKTSSQTSKATLDLLGAANVQLERETEQLDKLALIQIEQLKLQTKLQQVLAASTGQSFGSVGVAMQRAAFFLTLFFVCLYLFVTLVPFPSQAPVAPQAPVRLEVPKLEHLWAPAQRGMNDYTFSSERPSEAQEVAEEPARPRSNNKKPVRKPKTRGR